MLTNSHTFIPKTCHIDLIISYGADGILYKTSDVLSVNLVFLMCEHFTFWFIYQPKSLIQSCFVRRPASLSALVLVSASSLSVYSSPSYMETSYLVLICTYAPAHQIFFVSDLQFLNRSHFGTFLSFAILPIYTVMVTSYCIYFCISSFTYVHKRNDVTVT